MAIVSSEASHTVTVKKPFLRTVTSQTVEIRDA